MAFKLKTTRNVAIANPIAMFNDLRQRKVKGLLGNQTELLNDDIARAVDEPDVAIKVPTGGGKTLIGLCIAEWRRRHFGERAVYLCPNKQLVNQGPAADSWAPNLDEDGSV
jgi:replicative superfamily II helicase